ncbi:hypothetical protein BJ322DRAFT_1009506 [Thelephora terrestris]|uniref:DUF676 domain-containing protein n=1 Tax=Thelephora terrestris TaxID=56493 RepID=A0A9P6H990_9AGAM|nr:hypothetical protein BJ322DRAFT_1009506 [Thelephora terrestris]
MTSSSTPSLAQFDAPAPAESSGALIKPLPPDLLLVVFIHGFKGTDSTFSSFPKRLEHVLSKSIDNVVTECLVFPEYETKGELTAAVEVFSEWLTKLVVEKEVAGGKGGGAGKAKIVLCGHSMGGLLAADALIQFVQNRPDADAPLWPRIVACLAFDTPYLGLHPHVFKHQVTKAAEVVQTTQTFVSDFMKTINKNNQPSTIGSTKKPVAALLPPEPTNGAGGFWQKWGPTALAVGGAVIAAGAAASAAYYKKDDIGIGYTWAVDHMKYVGSLWDNDELNKRVDTLVDCDKKMGILFRTFYTLLPANPPSFMDHRTFIVLPKRKFSFSTPNQGDVADHFLKAPNGLASDEIQAHTGMFEAKTNDGYYQLGLETSRVIREAVMLARGVVEAESEKVKHDIAANEELTSAMRDVKEAPGSVVDAVRAGQNQKQA